VLPRSFFWPTEPSIRRDRLLRLRRGDVSRQIHLAAALAELGGLLRHAGFGGGLRGGVVADVLVIFMLQNLGPHVLQKCAILAPSAGSVSSWYASAVTGSSDRLNWSRGNSS
jgi:hypothetical protein